MADYPSGTIAGMAWWLLARTDRIRQHPEAAHIAGSITTAVTRAMRAIARPADLVFLGTCGGCQASIYAAQHARWATCRCGTTYSTSIRREELLTAAHDILGTTSEISRALTSLGRPLTPSVIRGLAFRGRITARGANERGHPLYRVGDVLEVISRDTRPPRCLLDITSLSANTHT